MHEPRHPRSAANRLAAIPSPSWNGALRRTLSGRGTLSRFGCAVLAGLIVLLAAPSARAAVSGRVLNRTTGEAAPGVFVTLLTFEGGMDPIEEVRTGSDGSFAFEKEIVGSGGNPVPGGIRVEYQGVSYSEMLPPGRPTTDLEISVYSVEETGTPKPEGHVIILEPSGSEMIVRESFALLNESSPPRAYRNPEEGTLRFWLPPEAKGIVQVSVAGPQRMPLRSLAVPAGEENVYKIDFALKPGENSIDLTYLVPYSGEETFRTRVLYADIPTRIAAPAGVTLAGEGVVSLGQEPTTRALIYEVPSNGPIAVEVTGQGRLARSDAAAGGTAASPSGGGSGDIRIAPAPVAKEMYWILGLTAVILGAGFVYLYTAQPPTRLGSSTAATGDGTRSQPSKTVRRSAEHAGK